MLAYAGRRGPGFYELMRQRHEERQTVAVQTDDEPAGRAEAATVNLVRSHVGGHFIDIDPYYSPVQLGRQGSGGRVGRGAQPRTYITPVIGSSFSR